MDTTARVANRYRNILGPDAFDRTDGWTILNDATENLTVDDERFLSHKKSLEFDKCNGTNHTVCGLYRTIKATQLKKGLSAADGMGVVINIPDLTDVDYVFWRLGSSASHYREWRCPRSKLTADVFDLAASPISRVAAIQGTPPDIDDCTYLVIGVGFLVESDALADILLDGFVIIPNYKPDRGEDQSPVVDGTSYQSEEGAVVSPDTDVGTTPVALAVPRDAKFLKLKGTAAIRFGSNANLDGTANDGYGYESAYEWTPWIPVMDLTTMYTRINASSGTCTVYHMWAKRTN